MNLIRFEDVSLDYGEQSLLSHADLLIEPGERVCLVGRNGAGKTTTFRLITGVAEPDRGLVERSPELQIAELAQTLPAELDDTVESVVRTGLSQINDWRDEYERLSATELDHKALQTLESLHRRIDTHDGWHLEQRVETILTELNLPAGQQLRNLSAGWRRRVSLARALVGKPDLLLLDEPTNHLDFSTIEWLENRMLGFPGSVLFITHDRRFLTRLATRIVELDRGRMVSWPGNYDHFIKAREKAAEEEAGRNALFDKKLAEEEAWIREGIKARRTRNEGRVRALETMREQRLERQNRLGKARLQIDTAEPSGRKVIELKHVGHGFDDKTLFDGLSLKVMRGDRIGLVGNNGVGKSTLIQIMLGKLSPRAGTVKLGTHLEIGLFDPVNTPLDPMRTVAEFVGEGRDFIDVGGKSRHIISYLNAFLFSAKRARTRIQSLSGGERNRVLLARVFTHPTNVLVLDEPTNDLDVETMEVLEQRLCDYEGTLLVVSHDRTFLDNVVTSVLVFESDGTVQEYVGGYSDWRRRGRSLREMDNPQRTRAAKSRPVVAGEKPARPQKLSYKLQRELDALPERIDALEQAVSRIHELTSSQGFYERPYEEVERVLAELTQTEQSLEEAMSRWSELESMQ